MNLLNHSLFLWISYYFFAGTVGELVSGSNDYNFGDAYDFIIAGGGTAGCVLAERLTENGKFTVLLLEAGGIPDPGMDVPALSAKHASKNLKLFQSVPQLTAGLIHGGVIPYTVGHALGGGSAVNGMMMNRGSPYDYDYWADVTGDSSWRYDNLLKYFKKTEDYHGKYPSESQHGKGGPITITQPNYVPGRDVWVEAGKFLGYPTADPNGPQRVSFTPAEYAKRFGRRESSYSEYVKPFLDKRPNLIVAINYFVKRIHFDGNRAVGVVFRSALDSQSSERLVKANKEIILSAGVIGSPVILLRSGVGPEAALKSAGISQVKVLPVGESFQDHAVVMLKMIMNNRSELFIPERDLNEETLAFYNEFGDGPYTANCNQLEALHVSSVATSLPLSSAKTASRDNGWPDILLLFCQSTMFTTAKDEEEAGAIPSVEHVVFSSVFLGRPKSIGRVVLNHTDPLNGDPLVDYNYYSHPDDVTAVMEAIQLTLKIFEQTPPYQEEGVRYPSIPLPECRNEVFRSDEYWRCYIKQKTGTGLHSGGTCKMGGGGGDPTAVVDSSLKVMGIENLRVVDGSIMPNVTNANTMAAVYVIAEKAADMILSEHN